mmetsp:Transcript_745/g.1188  ORF Transcript_745/g.1188 Transcript_745/m.1188 type:complete len:245 (+) Transcript_745:17-751(+)|eukprot:CAMPEP_0203753498 /NCGR_PEP_ID=MMETSP0098-20131031/7263_1 /ASSEMBLY_ACC=CAM_ASM_000208 /TAXON_ID=96639 /ORGANISM=" , Strain NY0313808BC1" /LENGTH=244 /DNA_ID=CAMNT_0050644123 /DNA_START=70 /DNA_END=804 /DNA_ORIENTATION=+
MKVASALALAGLFIVVQGEIRSTGTKYGDAFIRTLNPAGFVYGETDCEMNGYSIGDDPKTYITADNSSIVIAGSSTACHTVNTFDTCRFDIGEGGVTRIKFDYEVTDGCYDKSLPILGGFWMYALDQNLMRSNFSELDLIRTNVSSLEIAFPTLNTTRVPGTNKNSGTSITTFNGTHDVSEIGKTEVSGSLDLKKGYAFVLNTAGTSSTGVIPEGSGDCYITIKNLKLTGTVPPNNCAAFMDST